MSNEIKRAFYRVLIMILALCVKILVIQDLFIVTTRFIFGYNNTSALITILLSSVTVGIIVGEAMFYKERDNTETKLATVEYFSKRQFSLRTSTRYIMKTNAQMIDYIIYTIILFLLIAAIYMIRIVLMDWMYVFEALITFAVILVTTLATEIIEKYKLYRYWLHKDPDDE